MVIGAPGTTGACALRRAIRGGSAGSGCARPLGSRGTPATVLERRCAPAMTRSAQVGVCVCRCVCVNQRGNISHTKCFILAYFLTNDLLLRPLKA